MSRCLAPTALRMPISRVRSRDAHEHDVHDPDPTDDEADRRDPGEEDGEQPEHGRGRGQELGLVGDREVVGGGRGDVVALLEERRDRRLDLGHLRRRGSRRWTARRWTTSR